MGCTGSFRADYDGDILTCMLAVLKEIIERNLPVSNGFEHAGDGVELPEEGNRGGIVSVLLHSGAPQNPRIDTLLSQCV
jgi:hypothetical protein